MDKKHPAPETPPAPAHHTPEHPPAEGHLALHYRGTEPLERGGITFHPDHVVHVPEGAARALVGRDHIRTVGVPADQWRHFRALRERAKG